MTKSELRQNVINTGSHFFDHKTMKFFGDTMRNYGLRSAKIDNVEVWELYRIHPVKHGLQKSAYFRKDNYKQVYTQE